MIKKLPIYFGMKLLGTHQHQLKKKKNNKTLYL